MEKIAAVLGDAHLKTRINKSFNVENDALREFKKVIKQCTEQGIPNIILAGDTFDPVTSEIMDGYQIIMSSYEGNIYGILGQHDRTDKSWFDVHGVYGKDINEKLVDICGFKFYGLQYRSRYLIKQAMKHVPEEADFLVLHQAVDRLAPPHSGDLDEHWLPNGLKGVVIGDLHYGGSFDIPGGEKGYYTKTLIPLKKNEVKNTHGYLTIDKEGNIEEVVTETDRKFYAFKVEEEADVSKLDSIEHDPELSPFVYIDYCPQIGGIESRISEIEEQGAIVNPKPISEYGQDIDEEVVLQPSDNIRKVIEHEGRSDESRELTEKLVYDPSKKVIDEFKSSYMG